MKTRIRGKNYRVLYADGSEESVLKAAAVLRDEGLATPVIMSDPDELTKMAKKLNIDLKGIDIHNPKEDSNFEQYVHEYCQMRKHKGMREKEAVELMRKPHYFGAMMVHMGAADGMVSGLSGETKPFIPAFQIVGLREGFKRASSVFVLEWPERLLFFADCSVNINPDAQGLAEIAYATVETVRWLGVEPRVAFLSFSTHGSAKDASLDKIKEATAIAKKEMPHAIIDGEIQFDAALLPDIAQIKTKESSFRDQGANVFIFPDLNSGNIAYKLMARIGQATVIGPVLMGMQKPVHVLQRGATVDDIINMTAIAVVEANKKQVEIKEVV